MSSYQSQLSIPVPRGMIRGILLEPAALPEWQQWLRAVSAPYRGQVGVRYPVTVRGGLGGHLTYAMTGERRVELGWRVPGMAQSDTWTLIPDGSGTLVRHAIEASGPVARLFRGSLEDAADLRLQRLAERAMRRMDARYTNPVVTWWRPAALPLT
jgi:hypothetical protein